METEEIKLDEKYKSIAKEKCKMIEMPKKMYGILDDIPIVSVEEEYKKDKKNSKQKDNVDYSTGAEKARNEWVAKWGNEWHDMPLWKVIFCNP